MERTQEERDAAVIAIQQVARACGVDMSKETAEAELDANDALNHSKRLRYVNAYDTNRSYGGPEEGGWWYDTGIPLASVPVTSDKSEENMKAYLHIMFDQQYAANHPIGSVLCEGQLAIYVEEHIAADFPTERPHYE